MSSYQLAQINLARAKYDLEDSRMQGFVESIDRINDLAEASPGFIWRFVDASAPSSYLQAQSDPRLLINMSVWTNLQTLKAFVYKSIHAQFVARRKQWFDPMDGPSQVLWWVPQGERPSVEEGMTRLNMLDCEGSSPKAFTFRTAFPPAQHVE